MRFASGLLALLLIWLPAYSQQRSWIGPFVPTGTSVSTTALSTADARLAFTFPQFIATKSDPTITFRVSGVTGTVGTGDIRISLLQSIAGASEATATVANATDTITVTNHPFANQDAGVRVSFLTGGSQPGGVTEDLDYFACSVSGNTFVLSTASNCSSTVDITSDGASVIVYRVLHSVTNGGSITAGTWVSAALTGTATAGEQYHYSLRNLNGTPASNFPTIQYITAGNVGWPENTNGANALWGVAVRTGTTKTSGTRAGLAAGAYLTFADSTSAGYPWGAPADDGTNEIYGTRRYGAMFTTPAAGQLKAQCIGSSRTVIAAGTPAALIAELRDASHNVVATTNRVRTAEISTGAPVVACFSSVQTLTAATTYSIVFGQEGNGGDSSNKYRLTNLTIPDADSARALLWMYNGSANSQFRGDYFNGSTWSQSATAVPMVQLVLAHADPITCPAGGGGCAIGFSN